MISAPGPFQSISVCFPEQFQDGSCHFQGLLQTYNGSRTGSREDPFRYQPRTGPYGRISTYTPHIHTALFKGHFYNGYNLKGLYLRRLRARFGGWPSPRIELFERVREVSSGYWDPGVSVSGRVLLPVLHCRTSCPLGQSGPGRPGCLGPFADSLENDEIF